MFTLSSSAKQILTVFYSSRCSPCSPLPPPVSRGERKMGAVYRLTSLLVLLLACANAQTETGVYFYAKPNRHSPRIFVCDIFCTAFEILEEFPPSPAGNQGLEHFELTHHNITGYGHDK
jgi:hypothetical protein